MGRDELARHLDQLLDCGRFKDYCPNGLQVQGRDRIRRVVSGVTASLTLLESAIAAGADAVLVHHGYFWRNESPRIVGRMHARLRALLAHDINLFAYHLPLDAHASLGNNARLGAVLGLGIDGNAGEPGMLPWSEPAQALSVTELTTRIELALKRTPTVVGNTARRLRRIGWCTGGGQGFIDVAIDAGCDAFLSGEISEPTAHIAAEAGIAYFACGHHATERYGVQALGEYLATELGIEHRFIDIPNPA
ncbi:Nif3-like dinuclear metal center hexameric protein [Derxia gummosa]|uniref:Nif3-like dinuclear metal center hexameric protein n=1 Tax=Derxia gummosa DSM 723 TaxID=1121388 RepID=A0A8B6X622_9BURK|nr:Nif3-like dinuclear metal center hexameric protein [Derxia gummosa]